MKKLRTNKDVELMELKNGESVFIPCGTTLEILSNKDNRIVKFKYKGYTFKELIVNEYNGLELIDDKEISKNDLKNELLNINSYNDLVECMFRYDYDLSIIKEYGDKSEKEFIYESDIYNNICDIINITLLSDLKSDDIKVLNVIFE